MSVCADSIPTGWVQSDAGSTFGYAQQGDENYFMKCSSRGWAYILNMAEKDEDAVLLDKTLRDLHFDVLTINQDQVPDAVTANNIIKRAPELFQKNEDCIFIAVLFTTSQNQKRMLDNAWKVLVEKNDYLVMKPKILLLQEYSDPVESSEDSNVKSDHARVMSDSSTRQVPTHSDVLLVHGFGPYYIVSLCEVLANNHDDDVLSMLALVHHKVAVANRERKCHLSLPFYSSMLIHKLRFIKKKSQVRARESDIETRLKDVMKKGEKINITDAIQTQLEILQLFDKAKSDDLTSEERCKLQEYINVHNKSKNTSTVG